MMKKLIALVLIAMLLLSGCQTNGGQSAAVDATEPTAVYDWMAGESPVTPQRMGLKRMAPITQIMRLRPTVCILCTIFGAWKITAFIQPLFCIRITVRTRSSSSAAEPTVTTITQTAMRSLMRATIFITTRDISMLYPAWVVPWKAMKELAAP